MSFCCYMSFKVKLLFEMSVIILLCLLHLFRCVNLSKNSSYYMKGDNEYTSKAWDWLKVNTLPTANTAKENRYTNLSLNY